MDTMPQASCKYLLSPRVDAAQQQQPPAATSGAVSSSSRTNSNSNKQFRHGHCNVWSLSTGSLAVRLHPGAERFDPRHLMWQPASRQYVQAKPLYKTLQTSKKHAPSFAFVSRDQRNAASSCRSLPSQWIRCCPTATTDGTTAASTLCLKPHTIMQVAPGKHPGNQH